MRLFLFADGLVACDSAVMKDLFNYILLFLVPSSFANAQEPQVPSSLCNPHYYQCTEKQIDFVKKFQEQGHSVTLPANAGVYSGTCSVLGEQYDPAHEHHAYVFLKKVKNQYLMNGEFAFFYQENPYAQLTIAQAEKLTYGKVLPLARPREKDIYVDIDEASVYYYFIREITDSSLSMIGYWGVNDIVLCSLNINELNP